jgi:hypothetical protein
MRTGFALLLAVACAAGLLWVVACGHPGPSSFNFGGADASDASMDARPRDVLVLKMVDVAVSQDVSQGPICPNNGTGTVTGTVYDPAGINPLYNVFVYTPSAALSPIPSGPVCTQCQAPASGMPVNGTSTAADGTFTLRDVPVGTNVPIVLQLGKWRRHLSLPSVVSCSTSITTAPDGFFRLPRKQAETSPDDNIPLIAFTTGCDGAECFFLGRLGLDPSEFTSPTGSGRVHIYKSKHDDGQTFDAGAGDAAALWSTLSEWMKYDIVFDACECAPYDRGGAGTTNIGYKNLLSFLNAGGRVFTTHFFYNFFANATQCGFVVGSGQGDASTCQGQGLLPSVGGWEAFGGGLPDAGAACPHLDIAGGGECLSIDTSIPKGVAFADWYHANNTKLVDAGGEEYGYAGLVDLRFDMGMLNQSLVAAGTATPWLHTGDLQTSYGSVYLSFNTPVGTDVTQQCGRAIFSDVHLDKGPAGPFPSYCQVNPNSSDHATNELALEFLFFDLSSCVQNDTKEPPPPPAK